MKKSHFSEEQIIGILKAHEAGAKTSDLCSEHGMSPATFYKWKSKFGGLEVSAAERRVAGFSRRRAGPLLLNTTTSVSPSLSTSPREADST